MEYAVSSRKDDGRGTIASATQAEAGTKDEKAENKTLTEKKRYFTRPNIEAWGG